MKGVILFDVLIITELDVFIIRRVIDKIMIIDLEMRILIKENY
jgi:hypothetical protein